MLRHTLLFLVLCLSTSFAGETRTRVALAGDSTVTNTAGWGAAFARLLGPNAECLNFAAGGQSSKSFRDTGGWKKVIDSRPAYILIQFGHNDMPGKGPKRETDPATTYRQNLIRFIEEARAIGARPILVTSLARRTFDGGRLRGELKPYADAATKVATEQQIPLVDLFTRSMTLHNQLGPTASDTFNPPGKDARTTDHTHLNAHGAEIIASIIAAELRQVAPDFAPLLK